jgi:hypothetical protein
VPARLLALVLAVGMVVGALVLRNRWDDDGTGGGGGGALKLVCTPELEEVCNRIADRTDVEVTIEDAGVTAARLVEKGAAELDGWMTPGPWPQVVDEARRAAGRPALFRSVPKVLARTRVGLVVWNDRAAALRGRCQGEVAWRCLGEVAGQPWAGVGGRAEWGSVKPAIADPVRSAAGLAALGAAAKGFFAPAPFALIDLQENDGFRGWLAALVNANRSVDLSTVLAQGPSAADAIAAVEALDAPVIGASAHASQVRLIYPAPVTTVEVVLGGLGARADQAGNLASQAQAALVAAGWSRGPVPGSPLPIPGLLEALRQAWEEAA